MIVPYLCVGGESDTRKTNASLFAVNQSVVLYQHIGDRTIRRTNIDTPTVNALHRVVGDINSLYMLAQRLHRKTIMAGAGVIGIKNHSIVGDGYIFRPITHRERTAALAGDAVFDN